MKVVVLQGAALTDTAFTLDAEWNNGKEVTWNVTRIQRDINNRRFGRWHRFPMSALPAPDYSTGNLDQVKVRRFMQNPGGVLDIPVIGIGNDNIDTNIWCICDGTHRLTARWELKLPDFMVYIVPQMLEEEYRITELIIEDDKP